jgi:hypothetical protein
LNNLDVPSDLMLDGGICPMCHTAESFPATRPPESISTKGVFWLKVPDEQAGAKVVNYAGMHTAIKDIRYASRRRRAIISNGR